MTAQGRDNRDVFRILPNIYDGAFWENIPQKTGLTPLTDIEPILYA